MPCSTSARTQLTPCPDTGRPNKHTRKVLLSILLTKKKDTQRLNNRSPAPRRYTKYRFVLEACKRAKQRIKDRATTAQGAAPANGGGAQVPARLPGLPRPAESIPAKTLPGVAHANPRAALRQKLTRGPGSSNAIHPLVIMDASV